MVSYRRNGGQHTLTVDGVVVDLTDVTLFTNPRVKHDRAYSKVVRMLIQGLIKSGRLVDTSGLSPRRRRRKGNSQNG